MQPTPAGNLRPESRDPGVGPDRFTFRPVEASDGPALVRFHEALSPESQTSRFFAFHPHLTSAEVVRFTQVDHVDREALVVTVGTEIVAVGRYDRLPESGAAEVAFVTADAHWGQGLAGELLVRLADCARAVGVTQFVAQTLLDNRRMLKVFTRSGLLTATSFSEGLVDVSMSLLPPEPWTDAQG